ncbi:hypothetical protein ABT095_19930 [Kitasatospora sp. NPDC002227]|uniref:hypothetical protein n=1 Tax=Kitasatospora sp. NPDC002227 TaxID=3154773 RepID=UPI0033187350
MSEASDAAVRALREAMQRLIDGRPKATDGKMTKENLYREAGVSRATMNRATQIMAEWNAYVAENGRRTVGESQRDAVITELEKKLRDKIRENTGLRKDLEAAATVIAALHHDNEALRAHIVSRDNNVVAIDRSR